VWWECDCLRGGLKHDIKTWHFSKGQVLGVLAHASEFASSCFELNDTFMMCHSNNVGGVVNFRRSLSFQF